MAIKTFLLTICLSLMRIAIVHNYYFKPVICRVKLKNRWYNVSMLCNQEDPFQVAKTVISWNESRLFIKTSCNSEKDVPFVQCYNFNCSSSIHDFMDELLNQVNSKSSPQNVMEKTFARTLSHHELQTIIQEFEKATTIYLSAYRDFPVVPSSSDHYFFHMDSGTGLNTTTLHLIFTRAVTDRLNFVILCPVKCILDVLDQAYWIQSETTFRTTHWLLVPTEGFTAADFLNYSTNIPAADIVIVDLFMEKTQGNKCSTTNIYKLESSGKLAMRRVGQVDKRGNISLSEQLFSKTRNILNGKTLTVAVLEWSPFVIQRVSNGTVTYEGVSMDLLNEIARVLNFSYRLVEAEDGSFGSMENGSWSGLVGMLANKRVDLVVSPLTILKARENVMDFTVPYFHTFSGILLKSPDSKTNKWLTLIAPFRYEVHICILFSLMLSALFLFVVEEVNPGNILTDNRWFARGTRYGDILWCHFGALTANGGTYCPQHMSGKTVLCGWWLFTVISAATYSGNLIAFLTDWREKLPFSSLAEMVQQDTFKWGTLGGSVYIDVFQNSSDPDYQRTWEGMQNDPISMSQDMEDHRKLMNTAYYAYLGDVDTANSLKSKDCSILFIEDHFVSSYFSIGLQNNSIFNEIISEQILRINELGLPYKWYNTWKPGIECETDKSAKRVDILGLQSIFYAGSHHPIA